MGKSTKGALIGAKSKRFPESSGLVPPLGAPSVVNPSADLEPERLNSWKEISSYLGREIRTCYRWATELGLPIRRIDGTSPRSRVFAFRDELDEWLGNRDLYNGPPQTNRLAASRRLSVRGRQEPGLAEKERRRRKTQ